MDQNGLLNDTDDRISRKAIKSYFNCIPYVQEARINMLSNSNMEAIKKAHTELPEKTTWKSERKNIPDGRLDSAEEKPVGLEDLAIELRKTTQRDKILGPTRPESKGVLTGKCGRGWSHNAVAGPLSTVKRERVLSRSRSMCLFRLGSLYNLSIDGHAHYF